MSRDEAHADVVRKRELGRRLELLRQVDLFSVLSQDEMNELAERLQYAPFARGDVITKQGNIAHWLYIIMFGEVEVRYEPPNAAPQTLSTLRAGQFFGEMALLTGDARSAKTPFQAQSPKYGRSPLRTAMRALVVSSRSIDAIRRVNREAEGASEIAAVLDIWSPLFWKRRFRFVVCSQSMYTRCQVQLTCLHSSNLSFALQQKWVDQGSPKKKRPPGNRRPFVFDGAGVGPTRPPACAADRARRNRGSRRPDDR